MTGVSVPTQVTVQRLTALIKIHFGRSLVLPTAVAACLLLQSALAIAASDLPTVVQEQLKIQLAAIPADALGTTDPITEFYQQREFAPAWLDNKRLMELGQLSKLAELHGLDADDYQLADLVRRIDQLLYTDSGKQLAMLDLLATQSVARLAGHLRHGKVNPVGRYAAVREQSDAAATLQMLMGAVSSESLFAYLNSLAPDTLIYRKLQLNLATHRAMLEEGINWPIIAGGRTLEPGMTDTRIPLLRLRLNASAPQTEMNFYSQELAAAVAEFQTLHLLTPDGLLGPKTVHALNVPLPGRIDQLRVNLEWQRWAAMPQYSEYVQVNVAQYKMHWVQDGARAWSMRTQVGKRKRPTPVFKSAINAIMANPTWTVPPTIFREDILPQLQMDPGFLSRQHMHIIDDSGQLIDSSTINWQQTNAMDFPYRLRAQAGADNALGRVKFLMPNPYLIYLHDTPSKNLFARDTRAYSSGCIRIEQPEQLAQSLVARENNISQERLQTAMDGEHTRYIGLDNPMPIVVMYGTIDLDDQGRLIFADDIYDKDSEVLAALDSLQTDDTQLLLAGTRAEAADYGSQ